jgi:hypothetical protein
MPIDLTNLFLARHCEWFNRDAVVCRRLSHQLYHVFPDRRSTSAGIGMDKNLIFSSRFHPVFYCPEGIDLCMKLLYNNGDVTL